MAKVWKVSLPGPLPEGWAEACQAGALHTVITVPEAWCYRIHRPAPPGGWTRRLREELRPGLLPEDLETLWWDEELHLDGSWELWALRPGHLEKALPNAAGDLQGARLRICTSAQWEMTPGLSAFPNLAPPAVRPWRWPWARLRPFLQWGLPAAALVLALVWAWQGQAGALRRSNLELQALKSRVNEVQGRVNQEEALVRALSPAPGRGFSPFLLDLDALTRLLPEDTRAVDLRWEKDRILLDLITPKPDLVREVLESSPEFQEVRFEGTLERRGDRSRLTLSFRPEVRR